MNQVSDTGHSNDKEARNCRRPDEQTGLAELRLTKEKRLHLEEGRVRYKRNKGKEGEK